jgi:aminocarboxymuconate-semialdehyde decarboxylase
VTSVDVHAHLVLPRIEEAVAGQAGLDEQRRLDLRRGGAESTAVSAAMMAERRPRMTDVSARIADMDAAGVDVQIVSPSPTQYCYWADRDLARTIWEAANDGIAAHCARVPDRLFGLGMIPLQHPDLAVVALDHALAAGLRGVEISSYADGVELSDSGLEPFWARAVERAAIVFLHPFGCTLDERLDRWYLSNVVGQPTEHAVALSHLIFSGVLDRHPELKIVVAHGGGYLPTYPGRADHGWLVRPEARGCADRPSTYLRRLWFDSLVHDPAVLRHLVEAVGADRVLLGSDYPFDMGVEDPLRRLEAAGLPAAAERAIRGGNALSLFGIG